MNKQTQKTILITGCSEGSAGAALAKEFHSRGFRVVATSTNGLKMQPLNDLGITTLALNISSTSLTHFAEEIRSATGGRLDMLINNAAIFNLMPLADADLSDSRKMFDVNFFGPLAMVQVCLPLLLAADKATIANVSSISAVTCPPWQGIYASSKAALLTMGNVLRVELAPLGVNVITIMSGGIATVATQMGRRQSHGVPSDSLYRQLAPYIEGRSVGQKIKCTEPSEYAKQVADDLLRKGSRPLIWRGAFAWLAWVLTWFGWVGIMDGGHAKRAHLDQVQCPRL